MRPQLPAFVRCSFRSAAGSVPSVKVAVRLYSRASVAVPNRIASSAHFDARTDLSLAPLLSRHPWALPCQERRVSPMGAPLLKALASETIVSRKLEVEILAAWRAGNPRVLERWLAFLLRDPSLASNHRESGQASNRNDGRQQQCDDRVGRCMSQRLGHASPSGHILGRLKHQTLLAAPLGCRQLPILDLRPRLS